MKRTKTVTQKTREHPHRCECTHAKVKFCAACKLVHCLDCKTEWSATPCTRPHTTTWPWVYSGGVGSVAAGALSSDRTTFEVNAVDGDPVQMSETCGHAN